ncbi:ribose-phosphate pyrophosphokinase [Escherichia coli]|uniref:Ribose-phosphate pyrophosphokinase n=1 Tax=Escherichia coli TaxID=562 RepID=A0A376RJW6_ECOLX|nr:ribose-phosphate pyrophosphokinase [Escherichia coli]
MPGPHSFRQILSTNGRMPEVLLVPDMKLFAGNATPELAQRIATACTLHSATPL